MPPKPSGAPPLGFPPNPRRMGPRGFWCLAHLGAGSPLYSAHRALRGRWTLPVDPRNPFGGPGTIPITPETFPTTELDFPYINLHLRTILEILVMSRISSETPNNFR